MELSDYNNLGIGDSERHVKCGLVCFACLPYIYGQGNFSAGIALFFFFSFLYSSNDKTDQEKEALTRFQINRMKKQRQPRGENKGHNKGGELGRAEVLEYVTGPQTAC